MGIYKTTILKKHFVIPFEKKCTFKHENNLVILSVFCGKLSLFYIIKLFYNYKFCIIYLHVCHKTAKKLTHGPL